ncbi:hypothetical protein OG453_03025 [Streptomyces sp. NBC_01381]|uniref:hypothetical protein n=1 Tax=Streptomyces sp. NBC_01381 TaxID=2903845 RepID=UPI0022532354|nr:hypothetical protein [Streptomyces sp. NBC_01381]MCX4665655.1 hypothetical protein [Streptomyces sp. NBC_01381]
MAHAAPTSPTSPASSAPRILAGSGTTWAGVSAVVMGFLYGIVVVQRDAGSVADGNAWLGIVTGVLFAALFMGMYAMAPRLPRELRATAWATFAGVTFGYAYSQGMPGPSVLRSTIMALGIAVAVFMVTFYRYYTRETD